MSAGNLEAQEQLPCPLPNYNMSLQGFQPSVAERVPIQKIPMPPS
jgi:hypothetical protein